MENNYTTVIVGAGAAAMMCASQMGGEGVVVLEKMEKPLRKLRITGKGRCNLTNDCSVDEFMKKLKCGHDFFSYSIDNFPPSKTISYFRKIGLPLTVDRGRRVFPTSMRAGDVANVLENSVRRTGTEIICRAQVVEIKAKNGGGFKIVYLVSGKKCFIHSSNVIIATGGVSYPLTGSTGDGYNFAREMGIKVQKVRPSLVPLKIECKDIKRLNRLLLKNISLSLIVDSRVAGEQFGELEFFNYGIGGATTLRLSRVAVDAIIARKKVEISIDLKPALSQEKLLGRIARELHADSNITVKQLLRKMVPISLIPLIEERIRVRSTQKVSMLSIEDHKNIIAALKHFRFKVTGYEGFDKAIVTAGGVTLTDIDPKSMQSKRIEGLYFIGEVLDLDADTGGYNLQVAFSTAHTAANHLKSQS